MMRKIQRNVAAVMAGVLLLSVGCGKQEDISSTVSTTEDFEFGKDPLKFTWYLDYDSMNAKAWADTSLREKWIKENKKVEIEYIDSGGAAKQKLSIMIASKELPDAILLERNQNLEKMARSNLLEPLDDYMKKYTYMREDLGDGIINMLRSEDGNSYKVPNWANSAGKPNGNNCWAVNQKVYNELGRPKLETFDDLYGYLKLVKSNYPDMIPLEAGGSCVFIDFSYAGFTENAGINEFTNFAVPNGDRMESIFRTEGFKQAMLLANKLFREGLMSADTMTQTSDQREEKMRNGRIAVMTGHVLDAEKTRIDLLKNGSDWEVIMPIHKEGLDGTKINAGTFSTLGWNAVVITKNAKNPEGIYAFLDWTYSPEGQATNQYGPRGLFWDELNEDMYPILKPDYFTKTSEELTKTINQGGSSGIPGNTAWVDSCSKYVFELTPPEKRSWSKAQQYNIVWKTSKDITEFENMAPAADSDDGVIYQTLADLYREAKAKLLFSKNEEEVIQRIEQLAQAAEDAGHQRLLDSMTKTWHENRKNLNK